MQSIVLRITRNDIRKAYREAGKDGICHTCAVSQAMKRHFKKNVTSNYETARVWDDGSEDYYFIRRGYYYRLEQAVAPTAVFDYLKPKMGADATFREMRKHGMTTLVLHPAKKGG